MAKDTYIGEFRRGPAIFTVFASDKGKKFRVDCSDGNGPGDVCTFTLDQPPTWHGAWNGDEWCSWIEAEARKIVKHR